MSGARKVTTLSPELAGQIDRIVREVVAHEVRPHFGRIAPEAVAKKSSAIDLVTAADQAAERELIARLTALMPEADVFGEETVAEDPARLDAIATSDQAVVIDPIDGTWNYAKGIAVFGTIIAVISGGETVFGLIHDPISGESIQAHRGGGAWCLTPDGKSAAISVAADDPAEGAPVGLVGSDWMRHPGFPALAAPFARVSCHGASAHDYRSLCTGRYHASICYGLNAWDHAAGQLIHAEAGGVSGLSNGQPYSPKLRAGRLILAHTPELLEELQQIVLTVDAA